MVEWILEDFSITREEVFYEVRSLRQCAARIDRHLPSDWWTDPEAPDPFAAIVTAQLETRGGNAIQMAHGTRLQTYVAKWALDRLAAADLDLPPTTIVFPPARRCTHMGPSLVTTRRRSHADGFASTGYACSKEGADAEVTTAGQHAGGANHARRWRGHSAGVFR